MPLYIPAQEKISFELIVFLQINDTSSKLIPLEKRGFFNMSIYIYFCSSDGKVLNKIPICPIMEYCIRVLYLLVRVVGIIVVFIHLRHPSFPF